MVARRRWFTFSLRTFFVVLTIGCLCLGWKVETARKRGRAIDALVTGGRPVRYLDAPYEHLNPSSQVGHFRPDLAGTRVWLFLEQPLDATTASYIATISGIGRADVIGKHTEADLQHLEAVKDGCHIRFHDFTGLSIAAIERLQHKLPNSTIDCPFFGRWVPLPQFIKFMNEIEPPSSNF